MHFNDIINAVLNGLAEFRFQDFIDIVIITVIIYKIICWTVNTRAYQLLKGLAVLLVVMLLSALFNLYTVNYLLNTLLVSGIVVMVVLFQPELRRALAHIGRFKFNLAGREVENSNVIVKEMTNAMINLSKRKVGALVVIERETKLDEYFPTSMPKSQAHCLRTFSSRRRRCMTEPLLSATEGFITLHVFFRFSATRMFQRNWARATGLLSAFQTCPTA